MLQNEWRLMKKGQGSSFSVGQMAGMVLLIIFLLAAILYLRSQSQNGTGIIKKVFGK